MSIDYQERIAEKIKQALETAYEQGIGPAYAAGFMAGYYNIGNLTQGQDLKEIKGLLSKTLLVNSLTMQMVKEFIDKNTIGFDIMTVAQEIEDKKLEELRNNEVAEKEDEYIDDDKVDQTSREYISLMSDKLRRMLQKAKENGIDYGYAMEHFKIQELDYERYFKGTGKNRNIINQLLDENDVTADEMELFIRENKSLASVILRELEEQNEKEPKEKEPREQVQEISYVDNEQEQEQQGYDEELEEDDEEEELEEDEEIRVRKSKKQQKLEAKIDKLKDKILNETNIIKIIFHRARVEHLLLLLQKEIDRQNINKLYNRKKRELRTQKVENEEKSSNKIIELQAQKDELKDILKGNEEYDYESPRFMISKKHIEQAGGIEKFKEKNRQSDKEVNKNAADKIGQVEETRRKLAEIEKVLNDENAKLNNSDTDFKKQTQNLEAEQKKMIKSTKMGIIARALNMLKNIRLEINRYRSIKNEEKELEAKHHQEIDELNEKYQKMYDEIQKQRDEEAKAVYAKQDSEKSEFKQGKEKDKATKFRNTIFVEEENRLSGENLEEQGNDEKQEAEQSTDDGQEIIDD